MGILSRRAIQRRVEAGEIEIKPAPTEEDYDSDSLDVHLGAKVYEWEKAPQGSAVSIALWNSGDGGFEYTPFSTKYLRDVTPDNHGVITLRPNTFYLADLKQHTKLPPDIAMHIQGKSSLARLGVLVHLSAPHAHAGWSGWLTLEMYNLGPFNIELKEGLKIGQLTFWKVEEPEDAAALPVGNQFDNQRSARGA